MRAVTIARKPMKGAIAQNAIEYGCGALNVDGCRIPGVKQATAGRRTVRWGVGEGGCSYEKGTGALFSNEGRWPANLILLSGGRTASRFFKQVKP